MFDSLSTMRETLVGVTASQSAVIKLERVAPLVPRLRVLQLRKREQIEEFDEGLQKQLKECTILRTRVKALNMELAQAKTTDKDYMMSKLVGASAKAENIDSAPASRFKVGELRERLRVCITEAEGMLEEGEGSLKSVEVKVRNIQDDINDAAEELSVETGPLMTKVLEGKRFRCMALNPSNEATGDVMGGATGGIAMLAASVDNNVFVYELQTGVVTTVLLGDKPGNHIGPLQGHEKLITALFFFEEKLYTGSADWTIRVWNIGENTSEHVKEVGSDAGYSDSDSDAEDPEPDMGKAVSALTLVGHEASITCLAVDVFKIVSGAADNKIRIWDKDTGECLKVVHGHTKSVTSLHLLPLVFVSGGADGEVMIWNIHGAGTSIFQLNVGTPILANYQQSGEYYGGVIKKLHANNTFDIEYDDGDVEELVSRALIKLPPRDPDENPFKHIRRKHRLRGHFEYNDKGVRCVAYTVKVVKYASTELVSADTHGMVIVWNVRTGQEMQKFKTHDGPVEDLTFDATRLVTCGHDKTIQVTDLASGELLQTLRGHEHSVTGIQFDLVKILSTSRDGTVRQWVWGGVKKGANLDKFHTLSLPRDNIVKIAKKYKVTLAQLMEWNELKDTLSLYSGMRLIVAKGADTLLETEAQKKDKAKKG
jgi:WD40 repeat protein